jgi:hypothetical protein
MCIEVYYMYEEASDIKVCKIITRIILVWQNYSLRTSLVPDKNLPNFRSYCDS